MKIDLTSTIYLTAALQAVLMIFVISRRGRIHFSEKYLLAILVALTFTLVHYVAIINRLFPSRSIFIDFSAVSWLAISPLIYLYCRSLVGQDQQWRWRNLIYFPFSIYLAVQVVLISLGSRVGFFLLFNDINNYNASWIMAYLLNSLFFSILSIRVLQQAELPDKQRDRVRWLVLFLQAFALILVALIGLLIWCFNARYFFQQFEYVLLILYACFIFILIGISLRFSHYFSLLTNDHYGHDQRKNEELEQLCRQLKQHVEKDKPYLTPKLTLTDLSKSTGISENQLSQIFTRYLRTNFYQFVNSYRLKEFESQLDQKGTQQYTIMALAEAAGFASKATFYKVFKERYQMTPSEFIKKSNR
ncbi:MAG: helix-turn-helix transcriptional regulator [Bacteroidota bacterium]